MKIIDKKVEEKVYPWAELIQGEVYKDAGNSYVMATSSSENSVIDLSDGTVYNQGDYAYGDTFTLVNAVLEIR
jgi:hypothetical protein